MCYEGSLVVVSCNSPPLNETRAIFSDREKNYNEIKMSLYELNMNIYSD